MANKPFVEDIFDLTDSEFSSTSSSDPGIYETHCTYIFDVHDVKQDESTPKDLSVNTKPKKLKKKRKDQPALIKSNSSTSSDSISEATSLAPAVESTKEEFFDAHESYHTMSENKTPNLVAASVILEEHSDHGGGTNIQQQSANIQPGSTTARNTSSTVSKPVTRPE